MFRIALITISIITAACTTPAERRRQAPDLNLKSAKPAKEVAICISDKWSNTKQFLGLSSAPVSTNLLKDGFSVIATDINGYGSSSTIALADIRENSEGTIVLYYKSKGGGFGDYDKAVKQCL